MRIAALSPSEMSETSVSSTCTTTSMTDEVRDRQHEAAGIVHRPDDDRLALLHVQARDAPVHRSHEDRLRELVLRLGESRLGLRDTVLGRLEGGFRHLERRSGVVDLLTAHEERVPRRVVRGGGRDRAVHG